MESYGIMYLHEGMERRQGGGMHMPVMGNKRENGHAILITLGNKGERHRGGKKLDIGSAIGVTYFSHEQTSFEANSLVIASGAQSVPDLTFRVGLQPPCS